MSSHILFVFNALILYGVKATIAQIDKLCNPNFEKKETAACTRKFLEI